MTATASPDKIRTIRSSLHDLAQPLAAVAGLVDLMLLEMEESDPRFREVRLISEQLEKVLHITGEIRRMAREAGGPDPILMEPLPLTNP